MYIGNILYINSLHNVFMQNTMYIKKKPLFEIYKYSYVQNK